MSDYLQVSTATDTREAAIALANSAVAARLAGNAQVIGPVYSAFWHLGQAGSGEEWRLLLSTTTARYTDLEQHLIKNHPWDNPEIMAVPLVAGSAACFEWLRASVDPT